MRAAEPMTVPAPGTNMAAPAAVFGHQSKDAHNWYQRVLALAVERSGLQDRRQFFPGVLASGNGQGFARACPLGTGAWQIGAVLGPRWLKEVQVN